MATKSRSGDPGRKAAPKTSTAKPAVLDDSDPDDTDPTEQTTTSSGAAASGRVRKPWPVRLYLGEIGYDFIGKRRIWYGVSAVLILICLGSMIFRGFNLGVEFAGGERFRSQGAAEQLDDVTRAVEDLGAVVTSAQAVGDNQIVVITADLDEQLSSDVADAIADSVGVDPTDVANTTTSASWGQDVTSKALQGLLVFLVLVVVFLVVRFQWKMAVGAIVALVHDLVITAGVYSLVGFEVTPASVIGLLTILGFSLYDTVVVFDKVDENAKGLLASQRRTYSESANLAINQVLMRSINTSIFALLPVLGLLYAGVFLIGEGTLQDLALVLFVGMLAGVYSSIFLAAPVLCDLKEREPEYQKLAKRLNAKRAGTGVGKASTATEEAGSAPAVAARAVRRRSASTAAGRASSVADDEIGDASSGDESADAGGVGGTMVASARRTRPRWSPTRVGTTGSGSRATKKTDAGKAGRVKAEPVKPEPVKAEPVTAEPGKADTGAGARGSAGSRLAPRPGVKPVRGARTRGGSAKRTR